MLRSTSAFFSGLIVTCLAVACGGAPSGTASKPVAPAAPASASAKAPSSVANLSSAPPAVVVPRAGAMNLQMAIRESDAGKVAMAKLKKDFDERQKKLDAMQEKLKKDQEALQKRAANGNPELLKAEGEALQKRLLKLQQTYLDFQKELNDKDSEAVAAISGKARTCASQVGEGLGLEAMYDKADDKALWSKGGKDASDEASRKGPRYELTWDLVRCLNGTWTAPSLAPTSSKSGSIDMNVAVTGSDAATAAKDQLKQLHARRQAELDAAQAQLTTERDELEKKKSTMPAAKFKAEAESFQRRLEALQSQFLTAQAELKQREQQLIAPLAAKARECVGKVSQSLGIAAVYDKGDESVVYVKAGQDATEPAFRRQPRADLTQDVVRCVDAMK